MQQSNGTLVRHNPLTFYLRVLLYTFTALLLRILAFAPLACLFAFPVDSPLRYLAILCPLLLIFLVLPLRFSFAEAVMQKQNPRFFSFDSALSMSRYGEKLLDSLLHGLHVLKWSIPLVIMLGICAYYYANVDMLSLLGAISGLGESVTAVYCDIVNFFPRLFGSTNLLDIVGDLAQGLYALVAIAGICLLFLLYGMMRNSAYRYIWAIAVREDRNPHAEARRRLRGRRFAQCKIALINLVCWIPFLVMLVSTLKGVLGDLSTALMTLSSSASLPGLVSATGPLLIAFFFLYLPLLPLRRILTALFAGKKGHYTRQSSGQAVAAQTAPTLTSRPAPAYVPESSYDATDEQNENGSSSFYTPAYTPVYESADSEPDSPSGDAESKEDEPRDTVENASPEPTTDANPSGFTSGQ